MTFAPGHRVVVRERNRQDDGPYKGLLPIMAGHFGVIVAEGRVGDPPQPYFGVRLTGHIRGTPEPDYIEDGVKPWLFWDWEIEHAD